MSTPTEPTDDSESDSLLTALDAPKVPAVLDPDDPAGLLPIRALGRDLTVTFMEWEFTTAPNRTDVVELGFSLLGTSFRKVNDRRYPTPITVDFPQELTVPKDLLSAGVYEVSVNIKLSGVGSGTESPRKKITIDLTKPNFGNQPEAVRFPDELNGTITEGYLSTHGQVIVEVAFYTDVDAGDRAVYYWTDRETPPDSEKPIREQEFSQLDIDNGFLAITVYADEIRPWGSGTRYLYFYLRDRAGNRGPRSKLAPINVDLTPMPGALPPPRVPLSARGLIDRQHARDGVYVEIDAYDLPNKDQSVVVTWGSATLADFPVDPNGFPLRIPVPWSALHGQGDGPLRALVNYRIRHPGLGPPSPTISVPVNLTVAGQDHPAAPALVNDRLAKLEIRGQISDTPNKLLGIDKGLPAKATLTLFDDPLPLEEIEVFWGSIILAVARYEVQFGDTGGKSLEIEIPWSAIEQDKFNPKLPVYYTTSNGVNLQTSQVTEVEVSIAVGGLKEPTFPHAETSVTLHCCSVPRIWEGVTIHIPAQTVFSKDDEVKLHWQGCRNENGTDPIDGTYAPFSRTLSDDDVRDGFDVVVTDYEKLIAPMVDNASALVYYELFKQNGAEGESPFNFVVINRTMSSGEICSPANDLCEETWIDEQVIGKNS